MTPKFPSGWNEVADWYDGWVGRDGSEHHRRLAIPAMLDLLTPHAGQHIIDIGAGTGVLARPIAQIGARYTGIDVSPKLLHMARRYHGKFGHFIQGDARILTQHVGRAAFDAAAFLLSIQDMNPLDDVLRATADVLRPGGIVVIVMTHPCFRIPRHSGWGYEQGRKLQYRRVDGYLTPLKIPMKQHDGGVTLSFHRPLSEYINTLAAHHLVVERMEEITTYQRGETRTEQRANREFPLFMGLRARKIGD